MFWMQIIFNCKIMPTLSVRNQYKNIFFMIWIVFWHVGYYNILRLIGELFFSNFLQSFSDGHFFPFQLYSIIKCLIFAILSGFFSGFFIIYCNCCSIIKAFAIILLMGLVVSFLLFIKSEESTYDLPCLKFLLWNLQCNK